MGTKYEILAAHYPFKGYYEKSFRTDSFWCAVLQLKKFKKHGYEIIDFHCRDIKNECITWG